jgi:hypothetical protein
VTTDYDLIAERSVALYLNAAGLLAALASDREDRGDWAGAAAAWDRASGHFVNAGDHYQAAWAEGRRAAAAAWIRSTAPIEPRGPNA